VGARLSEGDAAQQGRGTAGVQVLLSTYNGEAYLRQQLGSVFAQEGVPVSVLARDDGSSDGTLSILTEYAARYPGRLRILTRPGRLGAMQSFAALMAASDADYVAFADQDDVSEPEKTAVLLGRMLRLEAESGRATPCLVHSDLRVVAKNLEPVADSFWAFSNIRPGNNRLRHLVFRNTVTGCAMICNRALLKRALPIPADAVMHDHWLALCASVFGRIGVEPRALVLYRQHGENAIGAVTEEKLPLMRMFVNFVRGRGAPIPWGELLRQPRAFSRACGSEMPAGAAALLKDLLSVPDRNAFMRRWLLLRHRLLPGSLLVKGILLLKV
jgi:glycosyltransferase involved in cell wall biosynthesis